MFLKRSQSLFTSSGRPFHTENARLVSQDDQAMRSRSLKDQRCEMRAEQRAMTHIYKIFIRQQVTASCRLPY